MIRAYLLGDRRSPPRKRVNMPWPRVAQQLGVVSIPLADYLSQVWPGLVELPRNLARAIPYPRGLGTDLRL